MTQAQHHVLEPGVQDRRVVRLLDEDIAPAWNREGICYAVAHGLEHYPDAIGRDVDVLIQKDQVDRALRLAAQALADRGYVVVRPPNLWGDRLVGFGGSGGQVNSVEVHTIRRLSWAYVVFASQPSPTLWKGNFKVDPWVVFVKRMLLPAVAGDVDRFRLEPGELRLGSDEEIAARSMLSRYSGGRSAHDLLQAINQADVDRLQEAARGSRGQFLVRFVLRHPVAASVQACRYLGRRIRVLFSDCAPIIALVGPDGVGKTTLTNHLQDSVPSIFTKVIARHWRPHLLPALRSYLGRSELATGERASPRRAPGRMGAARLAYYWVDFTIGRILKDTRDSGRQRLVLYDRCALDMAVDPLRYGLSSRRGARLLWKLTPRPDRVVLLFDDPARIAARKSELDRDEIARQLREWLELARQGQVDTIIRVDASPEELARRVSDVVIGAFVEKNGGDLSTAARAEQNLGAIAVALGGGGGVGLRKLTGRAAAPGTSRQDGSSPVYAAVRSKSGRRLLIPMADRRASSAAVRASNPQKVVARLATRLLATGLRVGLAQPFLRSRWSFVHDDGSLHGSAVPSALHEHLSKVFGVERVLTAISMGTPGRHQKPVIQVMTPDGRILGYVKVGWNQATIPLVQRDEAKLRELAAVRFSTAMTPRVLHAGWWNGCYLLFELPPMEKWTRAPRHPAARHLTFLLELHQTGPGPRGERVERWVRRIGERLKDLREQGMLYQAHGIEWALETCLGRAAGWELPLGPRHGDFTPWNTARVGDRLFVFDWEYSEEDSLPGWDLFHFLVQTSVLVRNRPAHSVYASIVQDERYRSLIRAHLDALRVPVEAHEVLFALYAADVSSWYLCRDRHDSQDKGPALRKAWESILFLFSTGEAARTWKDD